MGLGKTLTVLAYLKLEKDKLLKTNLPSDSVKSISLRYFYLNIIFFSYFKVVN